MVNDGMHGRYQRHCGGAAGDGHVVAPYSVMVAVSGASTVSSLRSNDVSENPSLLGTTLLAFLASFPS
jgi:hypothetical protein